MKGSGTKAGKSSGKQGNGPLGDHHQIGFRHGVRGKYCLDMLAVLLLVFSEVLF